MAKISFGVQLDEVRHAVIERVPEVSNTSTLCGRHAEVVAIAGEVCLARHADIVSVGNVASFVARAAVVAVGLVVAGPDHVRLDRGDRSHLVVEGVQDALICLGAFCDGDVGKVALDGLLEPVICVCDVAGWWFKVSADELY